MSRREECRPVYCVGGPCAPSCLRMDDPEPIEMPSDRLARTAARIRAAREGLDDDRMPDIPLRRASDLYHGRSAPTARELTLYADACQVSLDWLLTGMAEVDRHGQPTGTPVPVLSFDGCNSECRKAGAHTLRWGRCEHATKPEPTVSMSCTYTAADGLPAIGFDTYTVQRLADLIAPALLEGEAGWALPYNEDYGRDLALRVATAIVTRNDAPGEA